MDINNLSLDELKEYESLLTEEQELSSSVTDISGDFAKEEAAVDETVNKRQTMIKSLIKDPATLESFKQHPFKTAGRVAGGALEYLETVPASAIEAFRRSGGSPEMAGEAALKALRGESAYERGDILRSVGIGDTAAGAAGILTGGVEGGAISAIGKYTGVNKVVGAVAKYGKQAVAKTMSFLSSVPEKDIVAAIDNPKFLDGRYVKKTLAKAKIAYTEKARPIIENLKNRINLKKVPDAKKVIDDIKLDIKPKPIVTKGKTLRVNFPDAEATKTAKAMSKTENVKVKKWLKILESGDESLNNVDATIAEIDKGLGKFYKATEAAKAKPITNTFQTVSLKIRNALREGIKQQNPAASIYIEDYSKALSGQHVYNTFNKWYPHLMPSLVASGVAGAAGVRNPQVYGGLLASGVPKVQGAAIRGASAASKFGTPQAAYRAWQAERGDR